MWKSMRSLLYLFLAGLAGGILILSYGRWVNNTHFKQFNESNIQGALTAFRSTSTGVAIYINDNRKYIFLPDESNHFQNTAAIGDSIIKPAFSHLLMLKKKDTIYQFSFKKFAKKG